MKQHFIIKNNSKRLLLFFAGWGMNETPFLQIRPTDTDWMVCYDYRSLEFDTEGHIFIDGTPFKELILLEHIAELFVLLRHGFSFEKHLTGLRRDQPCDDGEDGRFSTPAGPDDGEKFSGKNLKGQIGEGAGLAAFGVVGMGYIF